MYNNSQRLVLLKLAMTSITKGLQHARPYKVQLSDFEHELQLQRACFVTLHKGSQLRGCIGSLQAHRPLVVDVSENAYAAAFKDPRFSPLQQSEIDKISISISVLTPSTDIQFSSENDLLNQIRPGIDGLILAEGYHQGTFLPSVWEQLEKPEDFLNHLKVKAGLPADYWSDQILVSRYQTESFE